ncbi:MAG: type II secretion system protein N [Kangiella sp.]|nr:type II secretion system protein N [Kangiella sp.]
MKKVILGTTLGLLLLIVFLVILAPARVVLPWVTQNLSQVAINGPSGTLWNTELQSITVQGQAIEDISIETSFWHLLFGNVSSDIRINDQNVRLEGSVALNSEQVSIENTSYQLEASMLLDWIKMPITELSGRFIGQINTVTLAANELHALDVNGRWQSAVVGYPNSVLELGDIYYTIERTDDGRALLTITDNPGMLDLKGTLEVGFDKQYQLNVSTKTDIPSNIKEWLTQLGRTENNRIFIKWNGRLP